MIDFRYHLVSIVAVFLALAVGIVMGTTLLTDPAIELAKRTSDHLARNNKELLGDLDVLRGREASNDAFITQETPRLVSGLLAGERVLLVESPGSSVGLRESQQQALTDAGAIVSGRISLSEKYTDPRQSNLVNELTQQLKPATLIYSGTDPYQNAATLLALATMTGDDALAGTDDIAVAGVLGAFEKAGLLSLDGDPAKRATLAVMFAPDKPFEGEGADAQAATLVALAGELDRGGQGALVAGTGASASSSGGLLAALRDSGDIAGAVSSVDTLDMPAGRVVVVFALQEQLQGKSGHYGIGSGASAFQPAESIPAKVPASTSAPTPAPTQSSGN